MNYFKSILFFLILILFSPEVSANNIDINSFDELMNTELHNGDTFDITRDLNSTETIGRHFYNYDTTFEGHNHYIDGENAYGGFVLSQDNLFNEIEIRNCKGQSYGGSNFAGAIYNSGGHTDIENSNFVENFVNSGVIEFAVAGAVYNLYGGSISIENSNFETNYTMGAGSYGGALANGYNDNGTSEMTINNVIFRNNYSAGSTFAQGGAIYNNGKISINNTLFDKNHVDAIDEGRNTPFLYGAAINNNGEMVIENAAFTNNYETGTPNSISFGGAIFNSKNIEIKNTTFNGNKIETSLHGSGGALYNTNNANMTITDSVLENNSLSSDITDGNGGAIFNAGNLTIAGTTMKDNHDRNNRNDIHNESTGVINFDGESTNNILSGIDGQGVINKNGSGVLNLGGKNDLYNGDFSFNEGTLNLLADSTYFNAQNTTLGNNINFNMQNNQINDINFGNLTLSGQANIFADVNFNNNTMDRINANSFSGNGSIYVAGLNIEGTPKDQTISIPFADSTLKDHVNYTPSTIDTPIYDYRVSYDSSDGNFEFIRQGFDSAILVSSCNSICWLFDTNRYIQKYFCKSRYGDAYDS